MAFFMEKIAAIRSRIICVSNNDNHEPQKHLWIICELQIVIINSGSEIRSVIASFHLLPFRFACPVPPEDGTGAYLTMMCCMLSATS